MPPWRFHSIAELPMKWLQKLLPIEYHGDLYSDSAYIQVWVCHHIMAPPHYINSRWAEWNRQSKGFSLDPWKQCINLERLYTVIPRKSCSSICSCAIGQNSKLRKSDGLASLLLLQQFVRNKTHDSKVIHIRSIRLLWRTPTILENTK